MIYYREGERHLIENYELAKADDFKGWVIHHRLELTMDNEFAHSKEDLIRMDMYFHRPYYELIYLRTAEHQSLHMKVSDDPRRKNMNKSAKNRKHLPHTATTKMKIGAAHKGTKKPWAALNGKSWKGYTWKLVDGKRTWIKKEVQ